MTCVGCGKDLKNTHKYIWLAEIDNAICYHCFIKRNRDLVKYISSVILNDTLFEKGGDTQ